MKKTISILFLSAGTALLSAQAPPNPKKEPATVPVTAANSKPQKSVQGTHMVKPIQIPATAVKTSEGHYRDVDAHGKAWIYSETPFGVSRVPEHPTLSPSSGTVQTPFGPTPSAKTSAPAPAAVTADRTAHVTAVAKGDMIHFERPTPFGATSWDKSKSSLTPEEQKIWEREQSRRNQ